MQQTVSCCRSKYRASTVIGASYLLITLLAVSTSHEMFGEINAYKVFGYLECDCCSKSSLSVDCGSSVRPADTTKPVARGARGANSKPPNRLCLIKFAKKLNDSVV